jgi:hypothetical protein
MSTGLELIPVALAIGAVVARRRRAATTVGVERQPEVVALETRFRDDALLLEALGSGARVRDGTLHGVLGRIPVALARDSDGTYLAYFHGDLPVPEAEDAVRELDAAYGKLVQREVRRRVLDQAPTQGLVFEQETIEADGSIVLTLQVGG